ncbi:MAG: hypothetical protein WAO01_11735, partial [Bradyrhizobium sp.]
MSFQSWAEYEAKPVIGGAPIARLLLAHARQSMPFGAYRKGYGGRPTVKSIEKLTKAIVIVAAALIGHGPALAGT